MWVTPKCRPRRAIVPERVCAQAIRAQTLRKICARGVSTHVIPPPPIRPEPLGLAPALAVQICSRRVRHRARRTAQFGGTYCPAGPRPSPRFVWFRIEARACAAQLARSENAGCWLSRLVHLTAYAPRRSRAFRRSTTPGHAREINRSRRNVVCGL